MATGTEATHDVARDTEPGSVNWTTQTVAFAARTLRATLRSRATLIWGFCFPAFWYVLTSVAFLPSAEAVGGAGTLAAVKAATAVALGLFGALTVTLVLFASGLGRDVSEKRYRTLRSLPVAPSADFAGRYLAGLSVAACSYALVLVVGFLDGARYALQGPTSVLVVVGSLALFSLIGVSLAVLVTVLVADAEMIVGITNAVLLVTYFLTGYNGLMPGMLPDRARFLVNVAPNALAARLQMWHLADVPATVPGGPASASGGLAPPALPVGLEYVALLLGWALALGAVAAVAMDRGIYRGEGGE
jgi:ABC-2 type transport system permease protein